MRINTNLSALNAQRGYARADTALGATLQRLSSGQRVNSASDDAASRAQYNHLNLLDGSYRTQLQAGDRASASGGTLTLAAADGRDVDISASGGPYAAVLGLAAGVHGGAITVLDTPSGGVHKLLVGGAHPGAVGLTTGGQIATATGNIVTVLRSSAGGDPPIDLGSASGASEALDFIDAKIDNGNAVRAQLGALQNRLQLAYDGDLGASANLAAARSRILDTDYASETAQLARGRILQQAAASMVAQANATPQQALLLLR